MFQHSQEGECILFPHYECVRVKAFLVNWIIKLFFVDFFRLLSMFSTMPGGFSEWFGFFPVDKSNQDGHFLNARDNIRNMGMKRPPEHLGFINVGVDLILFKSVQQCYLESSSWQHQPQPSSFPLVDAIDWDLLSTKKFRYNRERLKYFLQPPYWIFYVQVCAGGKDSIFLGRERRLGDWNQTASLIYPENLNHVEFCA